MLNDETSTQAHGLKTFRVTFCSRCRPLPGELNYDESRKLLPLPPNLPTHLPQDQDDLLPPASPTLPMEDDPSYIPPYSPEAIPPQSPIPAREDTNQYMLSSPQTPPMDLSPSSTPPPLEEDGGGEYSPSAPPFSNHKKSKTSDYRPSTYSSKKRLSRSVFRDFTRQTELLSVWTSKAYSDVLVGVQILLASLAASPAELLVEL